MLSEFISAGEKLYQGANLDDLDKSIMAREKRETNRREFREVKKRVKTLSRDELEVLVDGNMEEQKQILHLALCKTYRIYRDFVEEVLAEKIKVYDFEVTDVDYNSFISKKSLDHPELDELAESTLRKVKQVIFKMLREVNLIQGIEKPMIVLPVVGTKVKQAVIDDEPELLTCLLVH